jgi:predicted dehydrogenase
MLRAAVLGCGAIGAGRDETHSEVGVDSHAAAYAACPRTTLAAVCDADGAWARACAERFGVPWHTDAAALLAAEAPDLVSVCTPNATHAELIELALRASGVRGVLAEKPLALDSASAAALDDLARERGTVLAVNYSRRYPPAFRTLREQIAGGTIGDLQHVRGAYVKGLLHNGTHWLDLLRMLAGEPIGVRGWDRLGEGGDDPTLDAELTLEGGAGVRLAGLDTRCFTLFEMDLIGTRGRVRVAESGHRLETWDVADDARHPGYRVLAPGGTIRGALHDAILHAVDDVARCVAEGGAPACTGADGARVLALAEQIRVSAAHGGEPRGVSAPRATGMMGA